MTDNNFMQLALAEAEKAFLQGEIPIGAIIVHSGNIIAAAHNTREMSNNPLDHAEIRVLRQAASASNNWRLNDCTLYVTLEPCPMCLGALFQARVGRLVYGCADDKRKGSTITPILPSLDILVTQAGLPLHSNNHYLDVKGGIMHDECADLLKNFFSLRRKSRGEK